MRWCWLALVDEWPESATAAARAQSEDGEPVGILAAWCRRGRPRRNARRIDSRAIDFEAAAARVSLVLPPPGVRLAFDDPAVQQARRRVLADGGFDAVSTLLTDSSHFEGSVIVARGAQAGRLRDDPFARVFPQRILDVEAGLFGVVLAPAGPTIERYGSDTPWPLDRFA
jgi:hypothetical protein